MSKIKSSLVWCIEQSDAKNTNVLEVFNCKWDEEKCSLRLGGDVYDDEDIYLSRYLSKDEMDTLVGILEKLGYKIKKFRTKQ